MYFGFDDDQLAFRDAVRDLLDKECPPEVVRAAWDAAPGALDRSVWDQLDAMGVLGLTRADAAGGMGLDERSLVLLLEETGRAALPHPVVDTYVFADLVHDSGTGSSKTMRATDLGGPNVSCAADADVLVLVQDGALYAVEPAAFRLTPVETVDRGRRAARVEWDQADATLLTDDPDVVGVAFDRGAFGTAAQLLGLGQRMLDLTVTYVSEREQFGQAIGAFQAVKHHLADALKELAFARPAVYRAAHSLAVDTERTIRERDVSMAKAMASDAARVVGRQALQCHGAIGYTVEADLHLYLKRTWALATAWGDAAWHRDRVGTALSI